MMYNIAPVGEHIRIKQMSSAPKDQIINFFFVKSGMVHAENDITETKVLTDADKK